MHELPVMQSVLAVVLRIAALNGVTKILTIRMRVGVLSDLELEWMQRYFDHLSAGTPAQGARLAVEWVPAVLACEACGESITLESKRFDELRCPSCSATGFRLVSGREYHIVDMEAV